MILIRKNIAASAAQRIVKTQLIINIQMHALTDMIFVTQVLKRSVDSRIHRTLEGREVKMACNVPHLCQFIPIQARYIYTCIRYM